MMPAVAGVEKIFKSKTAGVPFDSDSIQEADRVMFVLAQAIEKAGTLDPETVAKTLRAGTWRLPALPGRQGGLRPGRPEQEGRERRDPAAGRQSTSAIFPEGSRTPR